MSAALPTQLEERLRAAARSIDYPRTPDVSRAVRLQVARPPRNGIRLSVRAAALVLVLLAAALAVPQVRAKLIEFLQLGVVRILPGEGTAAPDGAVPVTATPWPRQLPEDQPDHIVSLAGLAGETTLEAAQDQVPFAIRLPAYPADIGAPDRVFLQEDGPMVILVWLDPADPQTARLSLHLIGARGFFIDKYAPRLIQHTLVNGESAIWAQGPYLVSLTNGRQEFRRIVDGNTLIWVEADITYRLETTLPLAEALRIAESLQ